MTFVDQNNGELVEFDILKEKDLPFLNRDTQLGEQLRGAVIDAEMDDDCQTDDELALTAK